MSESVVDAAANVVSKINSDESKKGSYGLLGPIVNLGAAAVVCAMLWQGQQKWFALIDAGEKTRQVERELYQKNLEKSYDSHNLAVKAVTDELRDQRSAYLTEVRENRVSHEKTANEIVKAVDLLRQEVRDARASRIGAGRPDGQ